MTIDLNNRNALVLGSSRGIGKAIAKGLAGAGANVCLVARNEIDLQAAKAEIEMKGAKVSSVPADLGSCDGIKEAFEFAETAFGRVDILINNCGGPKYGTLSSLTENDWDSAIDLTLRSVIRMTTLAVPGMIERKWGRIVTVTSTVAKEPSPAMILSATTRAGVAAFMKALSIETASHGVTVNVVAPGGVLTGRISELLKAKAHAENRSVDELLKESQSSIPLGRFASPDEFANFVVFLCSPQALYVTGTNVSVDGGLTKSVN
jgi:3-oxoacyl-[acyl-carrier protein] reductase